MRVAFHVPKAEYLEPGLSGDKVFLQCLMACLRERGHELKVVSRLDISRLWEGDIPVWRVLAEVLAVRRAMRDFAPEAWLVYGASVKTLDLFGWWQRPRRYVLAYADTGTGRGVPWLWRWLARAVHRRSLARADRITTWRPKGIEQLRRFGVPEGRVRLLPFAVRTWDELPARQEARRRLDLPGKAPLILCVSRFSSARADGRPWKTEWVLDLLDVMTELPAQINLIIVGGGRGRTRVADGIAQRGLQERVRMVGMVPHDDLCLYYAACELSAAFARTERVFTTILESQGCGCPVVMLRSRATELAIEHGRTGLLAEDRAEFTSHIAAIALDPARREAMGRAGIRYIAENHAMEVRAAQIESLLTGLDDDEGRAVASAQERIGIAPADRSGERV